MAELLWGELYNATSVWVFFFLYRLLPPSPSFHPALVTALFATLRLCTLKQEAEDARGLCCGLWLSMDSFCLTADGLTAVTTHTPYMRALAVALDAVMCHSVCFWFAEVEASLMSLTSQCVTLSLTSDSPTPWYHYHSLRLHLSKCEFGVHLQSSKAASALMSFLYYFTLTLESIVLLTLYRKSMYTPAFCRFLRR